MLTLNDTCKIAVVQASPVLFDKGACTEKAVDLIAQAARKGAELIVFPELFIPRILHPMLSLRHDLRLHGGQPQ